MPTKKIEHYKEIVESRIAELNRTIAAAAEEARVDSARQADPADQAAAEYDRQATAHKAATARQMLRTLTETLDRIRRGQFGECADCGGDIEPKRLEAIPWARYCVKCQQAREHS